jgi:hypothetical protein
MAQPSQNTSQKKSNVKQQKKAAPAADYTIEDQGALLLYVDHLVKYRNTPNSQNIPVKQYKNFLMVNAVDSEDSKYFVNYLFSPKKINKFLNASPLFFSSILPKVRIYKVIQRDTFDPSDRTKRILNPNLIFGANSKKTRNSYSFLFPFEDYLSLPNKNGEISLENYGKAYGAGLQNVTIDDSSHPSTPSNLIVTIRTIYTDFNILFKKFVVQSEEDPDVTTEISFRDLFNKGSAGAPRETDGTNAELANTSAFRLKLEVGWSYDEKLLRRINYGSTELKESDIQEIKFALQKSSYTYYLGYRNFELDINTEGKIGATITCGGAVMMDFRSNEASVLYFTDPKDGTTINYYDIERRISAVQDKISKIEGIQVGPTKPDTNKKANRLERKAFEEEKRLEKIKKDTIKNLEKEISKDQNKIYKEFLRSLFDKSAIHKLTIKKKTLDDLKKHFESDVKSDVKVLSLESRVALDAPTISIVTSDSPEDKKQKNASDLIKEDLGSKKTKDNNKSKEKIKKTGSLLDSKSDKTIYYVYLGDILEYAFGALKSKNIEEFGNTIPMVGPFTYSNAKKNINLKDKVEEKDFIDHFYDPPSVANIADIPISLERFKKFLFEKFINPRVKVIELDFFIKEIFYNLVFDGMSGNVFGAHMKKHFGNITFGNCTARTIPAQDKSNPDQQREFFTFELYEDIYKRKNPLPTFVLRSVDTDILFKQELANKSHLINYYYMFANQVDNLVGKVLTENERQQSGIVDIQIGAEKGIFKKVSFAKSQLGSALAPAAVINNRDLSRNNPIALAGIMNADVEMYGNTFFSVGTKVHVDQSFLLSSPNARADEVIEFGLGGFYEVKKVSHDIEAGKFSTKMNIVLNHTNNGKKTSASGAAETPKTINSSVKEREQQINKILKEGEQANPEKPPKIDGSKA